MNRSALFYFLFLQLLLTACVTSGDWAQEQKKISEKIKTQKTVLTPNEVFRKYKSTCLTVNDQKQDLVIDSAGPLLVQEKTPDNNIYGYFKVVCIEKGEYKDQFLQVAGKHVGGGMGKAFYSIPRLWAFDENGIEQKIPLSSYKQNFVTGHLEARIDLKDFGRTKKILVVSPDNARERLEAGSYNQSVQASGVYVITQVDMFTYPTGKIGFQIKDNKPKPKNY